MYRRNLFVNLFSMILFSLISVGCSPHQTGGNFGWLLLLGGGSSSTSGGGGSTTPGTSCRALTTSSGACELAGSGPNLLIQGNILTETGVLRGGQVLVVADGTISCVDCNCSNANARVLTCPNSTVSPGLINSSEHITYNFSSPQTDTGERYEHRHEWRRGLNGHTKLNVVGGATMAEIQYGELTELLTGTTSTVSTGMATGLVRNIDKPTGREGLSAMTITFNGFPLNDSIGTLLSGSCAYPSLPTLPTDDRLITDVSESISSFGRNEFLCLTGGQAGAVDIRGNNVVWVEMAGLLAADYGMVPGAKVVWVPRSDISTYGDTIRLRQAVRHGWQMSLGTYWQPTGSHDILRELQCADSFNKVYQGSILSDLELWKLVTVNAADNVGYSTQIGSLSPGKMADIAIFKSGADPSYRSVIEARATDVQFVFRGGKLLYGLPGIPEVMGSASNCDTISVCGENRSLCVRDELGVATFADFLAALPGGLPDLSLCPSTSYVERTCTPSRSAVVNSSNTYTGLITASDRDGDAVPDAVDNCPTVFNPIRPLDNGFQEDTDGNGVGDACEP